MDLTRVIDPEERILKEIEEQKWLRQAVSSMACSSPDEFNVKVMHLTTIGNNIALLQRRLYELQHKDEM